MIEYKYLTNIISNFIQLRTSLYQADIDPLSPQLRQDRLGIMSDSALSYLEVKKYGGMVYQIADLLKTPRLLKTVLRRTKHSWDILHGEIDFDDLFIINVLRFAAPEAFDFILNNVYEIRALEYREVGSERQERKDVLEKKWNKVTEMAQWDIKAVEELLSLLFPYWETRIGSKIMPPQGVHNSLPTDYWIRANIEDVSKTKALDQEVLKAIRDWKSNHIYKLFKGLSLPEALYENSEFCEKFEQFSFLFLEGKEFLEITSDVIKLIIGKNGVTANGDSTPAFTTLWRLSLRKPVDQAIHDEWLVTEIKKYMPVSLRFVLDLYYYWRYLDKASADMKTFNIDLHKAMIEEAERIFDHSPRTLIAALDKNTIYSIYQLAILFSQPGQQGTGFVPEKWKWLVSLLLESSEMEPQIIIPQIVTLIFEQQHAFVSGGYNYSFKSELAGQLFGAKIRKVMEKIALEENYSHLTSDNQHFISFAQQTAKDWLIKNAEP